MTTSKRDRTKPVAPTKSTLVAKYGVVGTGATIFVTLLYLVLKTVLHEVYGVELP